MYKFKDELDMLYNIEPYSLGIYKCDSIDEAEKILKTGINLVKHYHIETFIKPMGDYKDLSKTDFNNMFNNGYVVLVAVPKEIGFGKKQENNEKSNGIESEFSALFELGYDGIVSSNMKEYKKALDIFKNRNKTGRIPTQFILGYVDVENDEFIINGNSIYTTLDRSKINLYIKPQIDFLDKELRNGNYMTHLPIKFIDESLKNVEWKTKEINKSSTEDYEEEYENE